MGFIRILLLLLFATVTLAQSAPKPVANFVDVAEKAGLKMTTVFGGKTEKKYIIETTGTGVAVIDYDNDGYPDIFIVNGTTLDAKSNPATSRLFHNNHDGTFTDVTDKAGVGVSGWGQGACVGDYDNDGFDDLYVTFYGRNHLFHNLGTGKFEDVTEKAGLGGSGHDWGAGCSFVDYDRDGKLDLVVANYVDFDLATAPKPGESASCMWKGTPVMCGPRGLKPSHNVLYHNVGGKFEDVTLKAGIDKTPGHYCLSTSPLDYDDDGWPDIYIACDSTPSVLYHNNHDGTFTDQGITAGVALNEDGREQAGMGSTIADFNGDGRLDIFKTNFSDDTSTLYENQGNGTFTDVTFAAGLGLHTQYLGWGTMFLDFDNDSWPDIIVVNGHVYPEVEKQHLGSDYEEPRLLYRNLGNGQFTEVGNAAGPALLGRASGRGLALADFWNDGRQSAVITNMNAPVALLVNDMKYTNHWLAIKTIGTKSNRDGIGATVAVTLGNKRTLVDEVRSGSSYNSNNDMRVHFGLGAVSKIDSVQIRWPSGLMETFVPKIDSVNELKEGTGTAVKQAK
jgi:enediyne biosynthesis protein E4